MWTGALGVLHAASVISSLSRPVIRTRYGVLRGTRTAIGDTFVDTFLKVPYARPPTGDLRFRLPQAPDYWTGVRDATVFGPKCPQPDLEWPDVPQSPFPTSEDCLYLNIYRPHVQAPNIRRRLPVMVWLHNGWWMGTGNAFDGKQLATKGVVVITINMRLSLLGFLSTEDDASPGNYGLWDIIRALKWVKNSISVFNGDPDDVTVFGESAGSVLASLLRHARPARGLFHKVIMESGCSLTFYAMTHPRVDPKPKEQARKVAQRVGCPTDNTRRLVACLRTKDAMTLVNATEQIRGEGELMVPFQPVTEYMFGLYGLFTGTPLAELRNGLFANVSTIRGFAKSETALMVMHMDPGNDGFTVEEFRNGVSDFVRQYFSQSSYDVDLARLEREIHNTYNRHNSTDPSELRSAYLHMMDDFGVKSPTIRELKLVTGHPVKPQYLYQFSYKSPNTLLPSWAGAAHTHEIPYVFGDPVSNIPPSMQVASNWTDEDKRMSEAAMTIWTNFAKFGNPTPQSVNGVRWLPWTQARPTFLDIDQPLRVAEASEIITPEVNFWIDSVPTILSDENPATLLG